VVLTTARETETPARTRRALIDCDFHNELDSIKDLYPYLSQRWRDHIDTYGARGPAGAYYPRFMDHREDARPPSGRRSGSEVAHSRKDFLDPYNVAHATLIPLTPAGRQMNPRSGWIRSRACALRWWCRWSTRRRRSPKSNGGHTTDASSRSSSPGDRTNRWAVGNTGRFTRRPPAMVCT
jgi:hypothetical protein